jgi:hypothetical protein
MAENPGLIKPNITAIVFWAKSSSSTDFQVDSQVKQAM